MTTSKKFILISILPLLWACSEPVEELAVSPEELFSIPSNFPNPTYDLDRFPLTTNGFELGRKLFYDGKLSRDGTISCAECHSQPYAFTHHGHMISHGIDDLEGLRNAPPLQNMAFMKSFLWDGGVFDLDFFSIMPITNPVEMDETMANVIDKLGKDEAYKKAFEKTYGSEEVNTERLLKALSQFMIALTSANSKYDKVVRGEEGMVFTPIEKEGFELFKQKCASCHSGDLFTDETFRNNGLIIYERDQEDLGRYLITEREEDKNKFKVPSLRNVEYTKPYMHNGRFGSLEKVLDHYSEGVSATQNLDPSLKNGGRLGIPMTDDEKEKIIAFLLTLSDKEFITNPLFAAP